MPEETWEAVIRFDVEDSIAPDRAYEIISNTLDAELIYSEEVTACRIMEVKKL